MQQAASPFPAPACCTCGTKNTVSALWAGVHCSPSAYRLERSLAARPMPVGALQAAGQGDMMADRRWQRQLTATMGDLCRVSAKSARGFLAADSGLLVATLSQGAMQGRTGAAPWQGPAGLAGSLCPRPRTAAQRSTLRCPSRRPSPAHRSVRRAVCDSCVCPQTVRTDAWTGGLKIRSTSQSL